MTRGRGPSTRFSFVSVWETILYLVVPSVGLYLLIVALVAAPRLARRPRYRVGQPWPHQPVFWTSNPQGAGLSPLGHWSSHAGLEPGGARGSW